MPHLADLQSTNRGLSEPSPSGKSGRSSKLGEAAEASTGAVSPQNKD